MQRLTATFRPQVWINDCTQPAGDEVVFDATRQFLSLPLEKIRSFRENDYDSDYLATDLPARIAHDGPFEVDTAIDEWLEECGYFDRQHLTQHQLNDLRMAFGVTIAS